MPPSEAAAIEALDRAAAVRKTGVRQPGDTLERQRLILGRILTSLLRMDAEQAKRLLVLPAKKHAERLERGQAQAARGVGDALAIETRATSSARRFQRPVPPTASLAA